MTPSPLASSGPPAAAEPPPLPPESTHHPSRWPWLDRLGLLQVLGGVALSLVALFSSYDHITLAGRYVPLEQQWGITFIAASLATILVDAQLATRSRLREAHARARDQDSANRERDLAGEERDRAAEARERQAESLERLDQAAVLSARVQLDPSSTNRARLQAFLTLIAQQPPEDAEG